MIALDTNLLVYSHRPESPHHADAKALLNSLRSKPASWAIPWACIHEFIGVVTSLRVFKDPTPLAAAFAAVDAWLASGNLELLAEGHGHLEHLRDLALRAKLSGPRIHDARIAALCLHHGVSELWSADRDFSAFPQLKVRNPLVKK
jgi:hypothetical protein